MKTAFWLFSLSVLAVIIFVISGTPGFEIHNGRSLGEAFGTSLALFAVGAIISGIVAIFDRKGDTPLVLGSLAIVTFAALRWYGSHV